MHLVEPTAQRSRLMTYALADDVSGGRMHLLQRATIMLYSCYSLWSTVSSKLHVVGRVLPTYSIIRATKYKI